MAALIALIVSVAGVARADESGAMVPAKPAPVAMTEEARAHYDRGLALYADKDYAGAIRELEAGYAIAARREFLFAEAQALRLSGDCKGAVPLYKKFLASEPEDVQVNATHIALARCAEQMVTGVPRAPPAPATPPGIVATKPPTPTPAPPAPWYADVAGGALLGAGVLALGTGAAFTFAALSARDDANHSSRSYPDYAQHWETAHSRSRVAIAAFASGAALTGVAVVRYLHVRARAHPTPAPATATLDAWLAPVGGAGGVAGIGGRF